MNHRNSMEQNRQQSLNVWAEAQRRALHEAVRNTPVNPAPSAGLGTGSGGANVITGLYGVADDGLIYSVSDFTNFPTYAVPFPNPPAICNGGDGYLYAVVLFDGSSYFLKFNIATSELNVYDNDIDNFAQKGLASLYREPGGSFILVDNADKKSPVTNIISIELGDNFGVPYAFATLVNSIDSNTEGFLLKQLVLVSNSVWATAFSDTEIIGPFDILAGGYTSEPLVITGYKNGEPTPIDWITSTVENNGVLYINAIYDSGSSIALFSVDKTTGDATWIKDMVFGDGLAFFTIFNI